MFHAFVLFQLAEGLSFLHCDANLNEGNLTADNVILTAAGQWKLAGFHFSSSKMVCLSYIYEQYFLSKQPFVDVLWNRCSKKLRNIHRKTPALEFLFNKVAGLKVSFFYRIPLLAASANPWGAFHTLHPWRVFLTSNSFL